MSTGESESEITLDNWKPSTPKPYVLTSTWRQKQNANNQNQHPGIDELRKIKMHLKRKRPDHEIMSMFGITSEVLVAIKRDCYDPVHGISLDNQSKIYKEFARINKKLDDAFEAFKFILDNSFDTKDSAKRMLFKTLIGASSKKNKAKASDEEE